MVCRIGSFVLILNKSDSELMSDLYTLPNHIWIHRAADAYASLSAETAIGFALGFVLIIGVTLLEVQDELFEFLYETCGELQWQDHAQQSEAAKGMGIVYLYRLVAPESSGVSGA